MRTTLVIDEKLFRALKEIAAAEGRTLSDVTQQTLRQGLAQRRRPARRRRRVLPVHGMGEPAVDVADRERLLDLLDRR
ncbi:MAG: DUF2191 domain-containing protein [Deltaproteobacteria bacterium]|nr:DUF2191 domain-containing protein [Deltaproteobacteria bacterium]